MARAPDAPGGGGVGHQSYPAHDRDPDRGVASGGAARKAVATLDQLSQGRVDLGVGTGWQREEYAAEGLGFGDRGRLLTDSIAACRALWDRSPASFESETLSFADIYCEPKPAQPRLPVWFAGSLIRRNVERVVHLGDGWIPIMGSSVEDIRAGAALLRAEIASGGGSQRELSVMVPAIAARGRDERPDVPATMGSVRALAEAGATDVHVQLRSFCPDLAGAPAVLRRLTEEFARATG